MQHKPKLVDLSTNYISDWPSQNDLQKTRELETLLLPKNSISKLPLYVMGAFPNLKKLDLRDNQIAAMPAFHRKTSVLRQLEYLDLGKNRLRLFPISFVLSISRGAGILNHSSSQHSYRQSPDQSLESTQQSTNCLQTLLLDSNLLESVPAEIAELESLQVLHLQDNRLSVIPASIFSLPSLHKGSFGIEWLQYVEPPLRCPFPP